MKFIGIKFPKAIPPPTGIASFPGTCVLCIIQIVADHPICHSMLHCKMIRTHHAHTRFDRLQNICCILTMLCSVPDVMLYKLYKIHFNLS